MRKYIAAVIMLVVFQMSCTNVQAQDVYAIETEDYACYVVTESIKNTENGFYVLVKEVFSQSYLERSKGTSLDAKYRLLCYEYSYRNDQWHIETEHFWNTKDREIIRRKYWALLDENRPVGKAVFDVANEYR